MELLLIVPLLMAQYTPPSYPSDSNQEHSSSARGCNKTLPQITLNMQNFPESLIVSATSEGYPLKMSIYAVTGNPESLWNYEGITPRETREIYPILTKVPERNEKYALTAVVPCGNDNSSGEVLRVVFEVK